MVHISKKGSIIMKYKRGIFCGLIVAAGSFQGIYNAYQTRNPWMGLLYIFALFLGTIQLIASLFEILKPYRRAALLVCFGIEGIYYIISIAYLLIGDIALEEKIFGTALGILLFIFIADSIRRIKGNEDSDIF